MFIKVIFNKKIRCRVMEYLRRGDKDSFISWERLRDCKFILRLNPNLDEGLVFYVSRDFYEEVLL